MSPAVYSAFGWRLWREATLNQRGCPVVLQVWSGPVSAALTMGDATACYADAGSWAGSLSKAIRAFEGLSLTLQDLGWKEVVA